MSIKNILVKKTESKKTSNEKGILEQQYNKEVLLKHEEIKMQAPIRIKVN